MMFSLLFLSAHQIVSAQELYVFTEPASNMPSKSLAIRLTNDVMLESRMSVRTIPEVMVGLNKNFMFHLQGFASNFSGNYKVEGGSFYAKYRFLSADAKQSHLRGALYGRISTSNQHTSLEDINLEGDVAGWQGGVVVTQLIHKLALSATVGYAKAFDRPSKRMVGVSFPDEMLNFSLSSGYLLLPVIYKNYSQPNFNLYVELLGKTNPANGRSYLDIAPAVQLILNSRTRIDLGYRFEAAGSMRTRYLKNMYVARVEFNFFNVLK